MGKKKSIVLMVLLTIVIVVLCAITVVPSFAVPGTSKIWNPAVKQYDFGADLSGGYYAYYYPQGVISETEYKNLDAEDQEDYIQHGGLYLSTDAELNIVADDEVTAEFKENFASATAEIIARYETKGYSDYCISVVDDYALKVQLPPYEIAGEETTAFQSVLNTLNLFKETSALEIKMGDSPVDELKEYKIKDLIKSFSVYTKYEVAYLQIKFTSVGENMIKAYKESYVAANEGAQTLKIVLGEQEFEIIPDQHIDTKNQVKYPVAYESAVHTADTTVILFNSVLENGGFDITFRDVASSEVRTFQPAYGDNTRTLLFIALAVVIVGLIVFAIVTMGGFGVANAYSILSYLAATGLLFAFVTEGVFEVTLGTVLVFLLGMVLITVLNKWTYNAIKAEFALGKTVESSVKGGYRKTLWGVVDIYAVLLAGAVALLIGAAGVQTLAWQAILCIAAGAFCSLLWTRVISFMLMSASKNKYNYFRLVREDDDDE